MQVSIIIINYNTFQLTCNCIQSIIEKTTGVDYEIILVDNASVECNASLFKERFPSITLVESKENIGFAGGNNLGIKYATGDYILLLNSDTVLIENCILSSYKEFKTLNNVAFMGIKCIYPDGKVQQTCSKLPLLKNVLADLFFLYKLQPNEKNYRQLNISFYPQALWGCYLFFKKDLLLKFKNQQLNELFFMYHEDLLWCWEASKLGYKNYFYANTSIVHIHKGSQKTADVKTKMNDLMVSNYHKLKQMIHGKYGIHIYNFFRKLLLLRASSSKK